MRENVLEVLYQHAKFGGARISPTAERPKTLSFGLFLCLSVGLSVRHAFERRSFCRNRAHPPLPSSLTVSLLTSLQLTNFRGFAHAAHAARFCSGSAMVTISS